MNKFTEKLSSEAAQMVALVISGKRKKYECRHIVPAMISDHMQALGWEKSEIETNGWQYDWWLQFTKDGKSFTAAGSGYYGWFTFEESEAE